MNKLDLDYQNLLQDILDNGVTKETRNGGTLSVFGRQIRHKMSEGFPLITTKKMYFKGIVIELLWFLRGDTNIKYLVDNDCHIWDGDAYKRFLNETIKIEPLEVKQRAVEQLLNSKESKEEFINKIKTDDKFAKKWGELGPVYGKQWRSWSSSIIDDLGDVYTREVDYDIQNGKLPQYSSNRKFVIDEIKKHNPRIDQITNLINDLKTNPDSRRLMVSAWNVGELDQMTLPPCHYGFQVYTRELSLEERLQVWNIKFGFANEEQKNQFDPNVHLDTHGVPTRAISLMWNQRSVDTFLGLPFNIASYGLLLEIIAKEVNMIPDELIGNLGDTHLYLNHIEQAKEQIGRELSESERYAMFEERGYEFRMNDWTKEEQFDKAGIPKRTREPYTLPHLEILEREPQTFGIFDEMYIDNFQLPDYQSHPTIKAKLSN